MIVYFDTTALLSLLVLERATGISRRLWNDADERVTCSGAYVDFAALLTMAAEQGKLTPHARNEVWRNFTEVWPSLAVIDMGPQLVRRAAEFAMPLGLDSAEAVHCAAVAKIKQPDLIAASGSARLVDAWGRLGVRTVDTHRPNRLEAVSVGGTASRGRG